MALTITFWFGMLKLASSILTSCSTLSHSLALCVSVLPTKLKASLRQGVCLQLVIQYIFMEILICARHCSKS